MQSAKARGRKRNERYRCRPVTVRNTKDTAPKGPPLKKAEQMRLFGLGDSGAAEDAPGVQLGAGTMSKRIAAAARAYLRHGPGPGETFTKKHMDMITYAVCDECRPKARRKAIQAKIGTAEKTGIGRKTGALMREYMGDNQAVAVDRHILGFVFAHSGVGGQIEWRHVPNSIRKKMVAWLALHPQIYVTAEKGSPMSYAIKTPDGGFQEIKLRGWQRGDTIDPADFAFGEKVIRDLARKCRVSAAAFQVAVWLQSACGVKGRGVGYSLPLTEGAYFACAPILGQEFIPGLAGLGARLAAARPTVLRLVRLPNGRVVTT